MKRSTRLARFRVFTVFCLVFSCVSFSVSTLRADRIARVEGRPLTGKVLLMNNQRVSIDLGGNKKEDVAANMIESIAFDGEPSAMVSARSAIRGGRTDEALEYLKKVDVSKLPGDPPYIKLDYDYMYAWTVGTLALSETADIEEAEKTLANFLKDGSRHYRFYEACRLYGDVLAVQGKFGEAKKAYENLAKAPWPEYNLAAKVSLGNTAVSENRIPDARKLYEEVIATDAGEDAYILAQKQFAQVGLARCLIGENKADEAMKILEELGARTNPENTALQAAVFATLGSAYEKQNKPGYAIIAYTSVDVLYPSARNEHIASLRALSALYRKTGRTDRAETVEKKLKDMYNLSVN